MAPLNVLMIGTGEYTTGYVGGGASGSDKKVGVVGLTLFDLRRRGKVDKLGMVGVNGTKFPAIRAHLDKNITQVYNGLDTSFDSFPANDQVDPEAYRAAIDKLKAGDAITIFTPDPTHYPIALYAIERGIHVLITKPAVKLLEHHVELIRRAEEKGVYVFIEHHKRFDPAYSDARFRAQNLGDWNYFYSYMSQPKSQLETFKSWAGKDSDISYYLNSHHVDICDSMVQQRGYLPVKVSASSSKGVATSLGCVDETEDTISLLVTWEKTGEPHKRAIAVYTSSWTAPQKAGVHTNQYFHYLAKDGEIRVDQAHRGYDIADDNAGQIQWFNPFYMRYAPDEDGNFNGKTGYGYISIEKFVDGCAAVNEGRMKPSDLDQKGLPTLRNTIATTAILEAGRRSIDEGREIRIVVENGHSPGRTEDDDDETTSLNEDQDNQYQDQDQEDTAVLGADLAALSLQTQDPSLSQLLSSLRRRTLAPHNRLSSIVADARFVDRVAAAFPTRPVVANERCGSWYVRAGRKAASAYFKSTDGHERAWKFSTRRLNLHLVAMAEENDGVIVVDSTRRGKRMPDALSTTIPIWCTVLNLALLPDHPLSPRLFLPPYLPPTTHAQITLLIPQFLASLRALKLALPAVLTKPLRPFWITQDSPLPEPPSSNIPSDEAPDASIFADYRPVICCTASRRVVGSEVDQAGYIQGAADDTENWAMGLTPELFWAHTDQLLASSEAHLPALIADLVAQSKTSAPARPPGSARKRLAPCLSVCAGPFLERDPGARECHVLLAQESTPREAWVEAPNRMRVGLGRNKNASRNLRLALPDICRFAQAYLEKEKEVDTSAGQQDEPGQLVIACDSGKDLSVGTALALSCYLFDDAGRYREPRDDESFSKTYIKVKLGGIMTAYPEANPSRTTLQSVNSFLMDWRR
ncbi:Uncharacterized protein ESCO_006699 [Escovopsis weberi]|uniref:Oxidoreductase n=1 Tax=Escovopsis weberi TaxID=150374 RepID=A0A0N0RTV7_ESCWE|nr:Uncharacterized protein ESCO_006699 [Escovopsis weberi]